MDDNKNTSAAPHTAFVSPSDVRGNSYAELRRAAMNRSNADPIIPALMEERVREKLAEVDTWVVYDLPAKIVDVQVVGIRLSNRVLLQLGLKSLNHLFVVRDFNMLSCIQELAEAICLPMYADVYQMEYSDG